MSILKLQARGKSQPTPEGPRLSMHCKTSPRVVWGESALIISIKARTDLSLAHVPEDLIRSRGRRSARDQMPIMRSRMLATSTQREERERVAWRDQTMALKETTVSVAPMQFIFAYNYLDNKDNRPQKTCAWVDLEWIERAFFRSPLNDIFVGIFWNIIIFFLVQKCKRQLLSGPS